MDYRREIDGLRALAVLPVILFHAGVQALGGGFVGVDVFFVISGYLITSIIVAELKSGTFTLANFYERRARRILPALFVVVLACLPFAWLWLLPGGMKEFSDSVIAVFTFLSNILFWRTSGYFDTDTELKPLLHTWSLAVEEQYYLFFPIFLMLTWRFGKRWILLILTVAAAASLAAAQWGSLNDPTAAFYLLPTRGWELLVGAFVAFYFADHASAPFGRMAGQLGSLLGFLLIIYAIFAFNNQTPFPGVYALVPTVGAALIILFTTPQTMVGRLLGSRLLVGIGLVSYSAYLWHQPLFAFARHRAAVHAGNPVMLALAASSVVLAYFSWRFVELPFRSKKAFNRQQIFSLGLAVSLGFIGFGLLGSLTTGFVGRYPAEDQALAALQTREVGKYVSRRFNNYLATPFSPADTRRKILIIGDSFAQDLVNALHEGGLEAQLQLSTRHVSHHCGNLFIAQTEFAANIATEEMHRCRGNGLHEDTALRQRMLAADEIWLVSRWLPWQVDRLQQSLANIQGFASKRVLVFGRKDFGVVDIKALLQLDPATRLATKATVGADTLKINAQLRSALPATVFVDVQQLLCGDNASTCALFRSNGDLISHDGGHLTAPGARFLGERLAASGVVKGPAP